MAKDVLQMRPNEKGTPSILDVKTIITITKYKSFKRDSLQSSHFGWMLRQNCSMARAKQAFAVPKAGLLRHADSAHICISSFKA